MRQNISTYIDRQMWPEAFACLSDCEQRAFVVIADEPSNRGRIRSLCLVSQGTAGTLIQNLLTTGIISVAKTPPAGNVYKAVYPEMAKYALTMDKSLIWQDAIDDIVGEIRSLATQRFEALEHLGLIYGNGFHAAQNLGVEIDRELRSRWIEHKKTEVKN